MKKIYLSLILLTSITLAKAQWSTNGNHIYTSNSGNIGFGTSTPIESIGGARKTLHLYNPSDGVIMRLQGNTIDFEIGTSPAYNASFISTRSNHDFIYFTGSVERYRITKDGYFGIGMTFPTGRLEVASPNGGTGSAGIFHLNGSQSWGHVVTLATDLTGGDDARLLFSYRNKSKQWSLGGSFNTSRFSIWEDSGNGVFGSDYGTERFTVLPGGNVGIGTSAPDTKLAVNGTIHTKEVKVDLAEMAPDYVFEKSYDLPTLSEIERYITTHRHLPEIPSAKEMEKEGMNVGSMTLKLLKKMEEMTLLMIQQQKKIQHLESQVQNLSKK
ncbi:tail fiber protein [Mucilaginibacter lacusdianchii]|uniref:tail fiber protein n=1 Tax=Mucilaginibacter lacusdianchii TaxID=2684211 RepID=UPI00131EBDC9|nr:tail fiber protein [Mucilaginibacter sp. JXJ CY 39]